MNKVVRNYIYNLSYQVQYVISAFFMFVLTSFLAKFLRPSIISTFLCVVVGASIYLGILAIMKDDMFFQGRKMLGSRFIK